MVERFARKRTVTIQTGAALAMLCAGSLWSLAEARIKPPSQVLPAQIQTVQFRWPWQTQPSQNQPSPEQAPAPKPDEEQEVSTCPPVTVRPGTASLAFNAPGAEGAMTLRYQATVGQTARECRAIGGNLHMRVGVQGRLILGPAGGPGKVDIPLRLALVQEGPAPKTHWTKLQHISVVIPDGVPHVTFAHVEEDISVPMPKGTEIDAYVVYVGFDAAGAKEQPDKKKPPRRRTQTQ
jgi:hypothetical protein